MNKKKIVVNRKHRKNKARMKKRLHEAVAGGIKSAAKAAKASKKKTPAKKAPIKKATKAPIPEEATAVQSAVETEDTLAVASEPEEKTEASPEPVAEPVETPAPAAEADAPAEEPTAEPDEKPAEEEKE